MGQETHHTQSTADKQEPVASEVSGARWTPAQTFLFAVSISSAIWFAVLVSAYLILVHK